MWAAPYRPRRPPTSTVPSVIYLSSLPPGKGTSSPVMPVYLTLQPIRSAAHNIAIVPGGLLPRLFTLTGPRGARRLFSVTLAPTFPPAPRREYGALRCPDFPPALYRKCRRQTLRPACLSEVSSDDTAFGVTYELNDFVALFGGGQLGLDALNGI